MKTENMIDAFIIGCGRISQKHVNAINKLKNHGANIAAVCDLEISKCIKLLNGENDIFQTENFLDEQAIKKCNLAVILSESGNHFEHASQLLKRGKDVLLEKPATLTLNDADSLQSLASQHRRKVYVVKQNRYNDPVQKAKAAFEAGKFGKLNIGTIRVRWCRHQSYYDQAQWRGTWRYDGGVIANQAIHHIDLLQWFMGPIKSVRAYSNNFGANIETEDTIVAAIEFESGGLGTIEATTSVRPRNLEGSLSLIGTEGYTEIGGFAVNELVSIEPADTEPNNYTKQPQDTHDVYGNSHVHVYEEILKDRMGLENTAVTLSEAKKSLKIIHMIYKSIEDSRTVFAAENDISSKRLGI